MKLEKLTTTQTDRMASFAREWIARGWRTTPLTEEEWAVWENGARRCYEYAGIPFPTTIVRVSSPMVGAFAAPMANLIISNLRKSGAVGGAVGGAVDGAVGGAVGGAVRDAVRGAVRGAVGGAVRGAVGGAVGDAVGGAVGDAVGGAVDDAVGDAVGGAVGDAVGDAVRGAVHGAVRGAVGGAVGGAVDGAVDGAVRDAVRDAKALMGAVSADWPKSMGGRIGNWRYWSGPYWESYFAFFRDVVELKLAEGVWDKSRSLEDADSAGWWWPFRDFIMVVDTPVKMALEQVAPQGWGSHRLHAEDGPAVQWADGWGVYSWHGTRVPAWVVEDPTPERIFAETNTEIRRCAIESLGWDKFIEASGMTPASAALPDPGNEPHTLTLYDLPKDLRNMYAEPARILLCTNGTIERDGTRHRYGLIVPAHHTDPIAAAADLYGWSEAAYRKLEVRR